MQELQAANKDLPLILAVHHPIYSAYGPHPGSTRLKTFLDENCTEAGRAPHAVLTGHVHNYQRFAAPLHDKEHVPFIVAGAGGYNKRLHTLSKGFHDAQQNNRLPLQMSGDPSLLENFNDAQHGYLRITVTEKDMTLDYVAVPDPSSNPRDAYLQPFDSVKVTF